MRLIVRALNPATALASPRWGASGRTFPSDQEAAAMATEHEQSDVEMTEDDTPTEPTRQPERRQPDRGTAPPTTRNEEIPEDWPEAAKEELRRARVALTKTNRENADRRRRQEELERQEEERKNASLGEVDRLKRDTAAAKKAAEQAERKAADAQAALDQKTIDIAVERMAQAMGFEYPDIAPNLIKRDRVEINDEGEVEGVKQELDRLTRAKPGLLLAGRGGGTPPREGPRRYGNETPPKRREVSMEEEVEGLGGYY